MIEKMLIEQPKDEFRLRLLEIIKEFSKQQDAELQIDMRNSDTIYLYSGEKIEFDIDLSVIKLKKIVQRTNYKEKNKGEFNELGFVFVPTEEIQLIRLDDIVSVSFFKRVGETEDV